MKTVVYVCDLDKIPENEEITNENIIKYGTEMDLPVFELCFNCDNDVNQQNQMIRFVSK
jgi:hypothetical protein